jgi:putative copper resistance protein D
VADCCTPTVLFVMIRAVHYIACLLLLAVWAFNRLILPAVAGAHLDKLHKRRIMLEARWTLLILPLIAISGAAWFIQLCVNMSGLPFRDAMQPDTVRAVWGETNFGRLWQVRTALWVGAAILSVLLCLPVSRSLYAVLSWTMFAVAGAIASSLAWAGHGQDGGKWHLSADAIHLFTAGFWPMGLAPFLLLMLQLRKLPWPLRGLSIKLLTFRFSTVSLLAVGLLTITGVVNSIYLIGSIGNLVGTAYGKVLILKVALFLIILSFASLNLLRFKPKLANFESVEAAVISAAKIRQIVAVELLLGVAVFIVSSVLGLMAPGNG